MKKHRTSLRPKRYYSPEKTEREESQLARFLEEISHYIIIRKERGNTALLREYGKAVGKEKRKLFDIITLGNAPLAVKIAYGYSDFGVPLMDMIQEGLLGLRKAINRYRADKGAVFSTYATYWINQAIQRASLSTTDFLPYRVPIHMMEKAILLRNIVNRRHEQSGRWPTTEEILTDLSAEDTVVAKSIGPNQIIPLLSPTLTRKQSLTADIKIDDSTFTLHDIMPSIHSFSDPEKMVAAREMRDRALATLEQTKNIIGQMKERERLILFGRLCFNGQKKPTVLQALADQLHISRERVRQVEIKALQRLKTQTEVSRTEIAELRRQIEELERIIYS